MRSNAESRKRLLKLDTFLSFFYSFLIKIVADDHLIDGEMETAASAKELIRDCLLIRSTHGNLIVTLPSSKG